MKRSFSFFWLCWMVPLIVNSQEMDLSFNYGRFWAPYKSVDYGNGFIKGTRSNYSFFPSVALNKYYGKNLSAELGLIFTLYEQYFGTREYYPAFASSYGAGHLTFKLGYSILRIPAYEIRIKGGIGIGIMPDQYKGNFTEMMVFPVIDSISRGTIYRDFGPVIPTIGTGIDFSYKILNRWKLSLVGTYHKGFIRISEYDIFYNDGNGINDQHARQWGTGDFIGVQLGLRYLLK